MNSSVAPTDRQLDLIEKMEELLDVSFSDWCDENGRRETKYAASDFIDEHMEEYRHERGF